jgi:YHS domain-containing protein
MTRAILELIAIVIVISFLRSVIGILKGFADRVNSASSPARPASERPPVVPPGGVLKKDPVCGTFISPSTAPHKTLGGETYYFCSTECRDKFKG